MPKHTTSNLDYCGVDPLPVVPEPELDDPVEPEVPELLEVPDVPEVPAPSLPGVVVVLPGIELPLELLGEEAPDELDELGLVLDAPVP